MKRLSRVVQARATRLATDDSGSALILALLIVLLVGAMLAAVLQYQGAGFTLASRMQTDRNEANYVQGAVQGAINNIRGSSDSGRVGRRTCPIFTPTAASGLQGVDGHAFSVTCTALASPLGGGTDDAPAYAIHTIGTATGEGIAITGNNPLFVNGPVYSNGTVTVDNQPGNLLRVNGTLNAVKSCTGNIVTTDPSGIHCSPPSFSAGDPQYSPPIADQSALTTLIDATASDDVLADPVPTCSGSTITFSPGYYGTRPDELVSAFGCSGSLWVFTPGKYVFDYTGNWLVKGYQVIGGLLVAGHTASDSLGSACTSGPLGVQFVFQGSGTMSTESSSGSTVSGIELCGPSTGSGTPPQRMVLYGNTSNDTATTTETSVSAATVTAPAAPTGSTKTGSTASWQLPAQARTTSDGGLFATTNNVTEGFTENNKATLTYDMGATAVPKGAKITSVKLRVAETLVAASASVQLSSTASPSRLTSFSTATSGCTTASPCDITSSLNSNSSDVLWRVLRKLRLTYTATADKDKGKTPDAHSANVDGVELVVSYTSPTFRQQSSSGTFFDSNSNPNVFMHGTVDTPAAAWSVNVHNTGTSIFDRGVVIRTIDIKVSGSSKQTESPFQLPQGSPSGRYVWFRGYVDGTEKVRACVLFTDKAPTPSGGTTAYYGYTAAVRNWLFMRSPSAEGASC